LCVHIHVLAIPWTQDTGGAWVEKQHIQSTPSLHMLCTKNVLGPPAYN